MNTSNFTKITFFYIFSILILLSNIYAAEIPVKFEPVLTVGAEIRGNSVIQDRKGFIWIATQNGLAKYDGYDLKWYRNVNDSNSISHNQGNALIEDHDGNIWIGTFGDGINKYDPITDHFSYYRHEENDSGSLVNNQIWALCEGEDGEIWIGTAGGVSTFNTLDGTFTNYTHNPDDSNSLSGNVIRTIFKDTVGNIWIGTYGAGLNKFDKRKKTFTRYLHNPSDKESLGHNNVRSIYEDRDGDLWIALLEGGLNHLDRETGKFTRFTHIAGDSTSISSNDVRQVLQDKEGVLWIISGLSGVSTFDKKTKKFTNYTHNSNNSNSISFNNVYNILEDTSGVIFFFNVSGKVDKYDRKSQRFKLYQNLPNNSNSLSTSSVLHIYEDRDGVMWFGGFKEGGLNRYDRNTGKYTRFYSSPDDPSKLKYSYPTEFIEDSKGVFWISTSNVSTATLSIFDRKSGKVVKRYENNPDDPESLPQSLFNFSMINDSEDSNILWIGSYGNGLIKFEKKEERFTNFKKVKGDSTSIGDNIVYDLLEDSQGLIWIGTQTGGLCSFDKKSKRFKRYQHDPNDIHSIGKGFITEIFEDSKGTLWATSYGSGFNKLNRETGQFKHYNTGTGFLTDQVQSGPIEDDNGKLWMSTDIGIVKFNPESELVEKVYKKSDGLQGDVFQYFSSCKSQDGEIWFAGVNGVNSFKPEDISDNSYHPSVYITSLTQSGVEINTGQSLTELSNLKLDWQENFFEFECAAISYTQPQKNQYKYKLEGLDQDWYNSGTRRFGRYSNIPGGVYTLRIKASNNDGVWTLPENEVAVRISVGSPFWKAWWFYLILIFIIIIIVIFTIIYLIKLQFEIHERKLAEQSLRKSEERYRNYVENAPGGIFITNDQGIYVDVNETACQMTGFSKSELLSMSIPELLSPESPPESFEIFKELKIEGNNQANVILRKKDGTDFHASLKAVVLSGNRFMGFCSDITDRIHLEDQLRQTEKMQAIGQLAGGIAHDFNNMLGGIIGAAQMLKKPKMNLNEKGDKCADMILLAATRASDLTAKLLAFGHKGKIGSIAVDIHDITNEAIAILERTIDKKIKISFVKEAQNHIVIGEKSALENALINLSINSSHAMSDGGEIILRTSNIRLNKTYCEVSQFHIKPGEYIKIEVRDTGSGIPPEYLQKIFEPFFTTKGQGLGTGLGLASVYGTIKNHNGAIYVYSEVGTGTVFHILLPCSRDSVESLQNIGEIITGEGLILLVDDEEIIRITGKDLLKEMGYDVILAKNGLEAVDVFKTRHKEIDLVIMDMIMPEMSGSEAFIKLKKIDKNCKVIIASGFTKDESLDQMKELGLCGFINKPYRDFELGKLLAQILK